MKTKAILAWHFVADKLRDGRPIPDNGVWLKHEGKCVMCQAGLHASRRLLDALTYAPGKMLCRVECVDVAAEQDDKLVCHKRKIIARFDSEELLWRASRKFALDVIPLWDAPPVVIKFLKTGDKSLRDAAWDAATDAARGAVWDPARGAASAAARGAARDAVWEAARDAARASAWGVASGVARGVARGAAWDAETDAQNKWITREAMKIIRRH